MSTYSHLLVMTDFSEDSLHAVAVAAELAGLYGAKLTVMNVVHDESLLSGYVNDKDLEEIMNHLDGESSTGFAEMEARMPQLAQLGYEKIMRRGAPAAEGLKEIETGKYDLVVVGSHGRSNVKKFLYGSTSEKLVRDACVSVHVTRLSCRT